MTQTHKEQAKTFIDTPSVNMHGLFKGIGYALLALVDELEKVTEQLKAYNKPIITMMGKEPQIKYIIPEPVLTPNTCQHPDLQYFPVGPTSGGCGETYTPGGYSSCPGCNSFFDHVKGIYPHNWHESNAPYKQREDWNK